MSEFERQAGITANELLDAMKIIHSMSKENMEDVFHVSRHFYDREALIKYIVNNYTPEQLVFVTNTWMESRIFNKDDIVKNLQSGWFSIVTYNDGKKIHIMDFDGMTSVHDADTFERWFTKTKDVCKLKDFLEYAKGRVKEIE